MLGRITIKGAMTKRELIQALESSPLPDSTPMLTESAGRLYPVQVPSARGVLGVSDKGDRNKIAVRYYHASDREALRRDPRNVIKEIWALEI